MLFDANSLIAPPGYGKTTSLLTKVKHNDLVIAMTSAAVAKIKTFVGRKCMVLSV